MKTIKEMIEVMEHFENGGAVEVKHNMAKDWYKTDKPAWNWGAQDYRIAEEKAEPYSHDVYEYMVKNFNGGAYWYILPELLTEAEAADVLKEYEYKKTGRQFEVEV